MISDDINTGLNRLLWADAIYVKDNECLQQAPERKLIKVAILLNDLYMSRDFCHHLLSIADQMSGNEFAPAYLNYLIGETNELNQLLAETSPG